MAKRFFDIPSWDDEETEPFGRRPGDARRAGTPAARMPSARARGDAGRAAAPDDSGAPTPRPSRIRSFFGDVPTNTEPTVLSVPARPGLGDRYNSGTRALDSGYKTRYADFMKDIRDLQDSYSSRYTENYDDVYHGDAADYAAGFRDAQGLINRTAASLLKDIEALRGDYGDEWARSAAADVVGRMNKLSGLADFVGRDAANWSRYRDETDYSAAMFNDRPTRRYGSTHNAAKEALEGTRALSDSAALLGATDENNDYIKGMMIDSTRGNLPTANLPDSTEDTSKGIIGLLNKFARNIIAKHTDTNIKDAELALTYIFPFAAIQVFKTSKMAQDTAANIFGAGNTPDAVAANAFQHAFWNALMVCAIGEKKTELFSDAHESWDPAKLPEVQSTGFTLQEVTDMDQYNNAVGREIGASVLGTNIQKELMNRFGSQEAIDAAAENYGLTDNRDILLAVLVMDALNNGELIYLID